MSRKSWLYRELHRPVYKATWFDFYEHDPEKYIEKQEGQPRASLNNAQGTRVLFPSCQTMFKKIKGTHDVATRIVNR